MLRIWTVPLTVRVKEWIPSEVLIRSEYMILRANESSGLCTSQGNICLKINWVMR